MPSSVFGMLQILLNFIKNKTPSIAKPANILFTLLSSSMNGLEIQLSSAALVWHAQGAGFSPQNHLSKPISPMR